MISVGDWKFLKLSFVSLVLTGTATPPPENVTPTLTEENSTPNKQAEKVVKVDPLLESKLLEHLCNPSLTFPVDSVQLTSSLLSKVCCISLLTEWEGRMGKYFA